VIYIYALWSHSLPPDELHKVKAAQEKKSLDRSNGAPFLHSLRCSCRWRCSGQPRAAGNTIALWADDRTDRTISLLFWHGEIPTTWFQPQPVRLHALGGAVDVAGGRGRTSTVVKMSLGCFVRALLCDHGRRRLAGRRRRCELALAVRLFRRDHDRGTLLSPIGLSLVSKVAPARMVSMMMGVWLGRASSATSWPAISAAFGAPWTRCTSS
jgi:POT family proton-dependent oligopeptide transporter